MDLRGTNQVTTLFLKIRNSMRKNIIIYNTKTKTILKKTLSHHFKINHRSMSTI